VSSDTMRDVSGLYKGIYAQLIKIACPVEPYISIGADSVNSTISG